MNETTPHLRVKIRKDPLLGRRLRINVKSREGFTPAEVKLHESAMVIVEMVVNSAEFKSRVQNRSYSTTTKSPTQIYDHIMTGEEVLQKGKDYEIDAEIEMYSAETNTIGYTYQNTVKTWLNRVFASKYSEEQIAGNFIHEWLHKLGYQHSSAKDYDSVPYAIGYLVRDMVKEFKKGKRWLDLYPPVPIVREVCETNWKTLGLTQKCYYENVTS